MASTSAAYGLKPFRHAKGGTLRVEQLINGIASGYNTNIYTGDPLQLNTSGQLVKFTGTTGAVDGVFAGVFLTDATGNTRELPSWPAGQTVLAGTFVNLLWWRDPDIEYQIQADGSIPYLSAGGSGAVGATIQMTNLTAGSTLNGQSQATAGASTIAFTSGATNPLKIVGFSNGVNDLPGDAFTNVQVIINTAAGFVPGAAV